MTEAPRDRMVNLDAEISEIQQALAGFDAGARRNVAVVGYPLSGKSTLIEAVIARYGKQIRKVSLTSIRDDVEDITAAAGGDRIIAIDDCQYLFTRRIGGFGTLERFLDIVATSDHLFLTTWNTFAWNYLKQVFDLQDYFPVRVAMPEMGPESIAAIIGARYDPGNTRYVDDADSNGQLWKLKQGRFRLRGIAAAVVDSGRDRDDSGLQSAIFEKIAKLSNGNPGVAMAIWQRAYIDGEIRTGLIEVPDFETDMSPDQAFVLSNILMMKSATREDLQKITVGHLKMDRILFTLIDRGLIIKDSGRFVVEPLALYAIIHSLKKSRQVW
ncbi:MAG: hypothetical protein A4E28_00460 [Methanocella sp. PtaU1.Bin125]|nr:MAG: hypothetical protein A4E28_00460 [Methanocella sp. PtaU1.Bin125]